MALLNEPVGPLPPFDPGLAAVATAYEEQLAQFVEVFSADGVAAAVAAMREGTAVGLEPAGDLTRNGALAVSERIVPGPAGAPAVELLICLPTGTPAPCGAIHRIHGGGMIGGDRYLNMPMYAGIAEELGLAVISVEYRLAPEHPHPAPVEDCFAGLAWTVRNAAELGIDPGTPTPAEAVRLSEHFRTAWTTFASTGDPGWPAFDTEHRLTQVFGVPSTVSAYPEENSRGLWQHHEFPPLPLRS